MRFMMILKADDRTEAGVLPTEEELAAMARYNEELVKAGVLLGADGLKPSAQGARVRWEGGKPRVIDGPFTESKELIAGYWMIQVKSKEEAIEWARRAPFRILPGQERGAEIELRPVFELDDFVQGEAIEEHRRQGEVLEERRRAGAAGGE